MRSSGPLEDRAAIRELCEQYCEAIFNKDEKLWGDTWAEDGEWFHAGETTKGRSAIVESWIKTMDPIEKCGFYCMMGAIEVNGSTATARCYHHDALVRNSTVSRGISYYDDTYVKRDGKWYFQKRLLTNVWRD